MRRVNGLVGGWLLSLGCLAPVTIHAAESPPVVVAIPGDAIWNEAVRNAEAGNLSAAALHFQILVSSHPEHPQAETARLRLAQLQLQQPGKLPIAPMAPQFIPHTISESRKLDLMTSTRPARADSAKRIPAMLGAMLGNPMWGWMVESLDACEEIPLGEETSEPPLAKPQSRRKAPTPAPKSGTIPTSDTTIPPLEPKESMWEWLHGEYQIELRIEKNRVRLMIHGKSYEQPRK
ncbi:hypothetical protein [Tuwongella immobilis]|uniref:Uncharacterized protein n=1 Tax=Tuwongella immobilis TaxID=692036 RepID=A0A6C2YJ47_9BACT|nr:hypothetical protein [Tuwongella immobilis]VIP01002.1 unnamed protein product [Tuwongella immobilis]VTR97428.1 unnamed protein product [Tuwongella immobilis]